VLFQRVMLNLVLICKAEVGIKFLSLASRFWHWMYENVDRVDDFFLRFSFLREQWLAKLNFGAFLLAFKLHIEPPCLNVFTEDFNAKVCLEYSRQIVF